MDYLAEATYPLAQMLADSAPIGGDFTTMLYRSAANGSAFIALNNDQHNDVQVMQVSLSPHHKLQATRVYDAVLWDGLAQFSTLATGTGKELSQAVFTVALEANSTKVVAFVPPGTLRGSAH